MIALVVTIAGTALAAGSAMALAMRTDMREAREAGRKVLSVRDAMLTPTNPG